MLEVMKQHVSIRSEVISHYFLYLQEFEKYYTSTTRLYSPLVICLQRTIQFKNSLLICDNWWGAKHAFNELCCSDFWIEMAQSYPMSSLSQVIRLCHVRRLSLLYLLLKQNPETDLTCQMTSETEQPTVALTKTKPNKWKNWFRQSSCIQFKFEFKIDD